MLAVLLTGTLHETKRTDVQTAGIKAGFVALRTRWVVDRTQAWAERWRRTVMHHDRRLDISAAWVWLGEARMLQTRLAYQH